MVPGQVQRRVAANLRLIVAQAKAGEILGKAFIKPILRGRIVETQKQTRKVVQDRSPAVFGRKIKHDVVAVVPGQKKTGS